MCSDLHAKLGFTATPQVNLRPLLRATSREWRANLRRLFQRSHFILGEELRAFEVEFASALGGKFSVGVANGTAAIELCLRDAGVTSGEVITSALTAPFSGVGIRASGAIPKFADIDPETLQIDAADAAARITTRTCALMPVHLYGQPCALDRFAKLARKYKIPLIQDAAQAHGACFNGKPLAEFSRYIAYSFYPTKNLGCMGDGGGIITDNASTCDRLVVLRDGGRRGDQVAHSFGVNSRLDELQCCFLRAFLPHLNDWNADRARLASIYDEELRDCPGVRLVKKTEGSVHHLYVIRAERRDQLREHLASLGIGTAVHYPVPLHKHPAFAQKGSLPHAELAVTQIVSLPLWPYLKESAARRVAKKIRRFYGRA
jgi:dTDP-3-amino-3,4,6-trideoxy-alpha-D-glucose transaminase